MNKSPEIWVQEIHQNAVSHGWWIEDFSLLCFRQHRTKHT